MTSKELADYLLKQTEISKSASWNKKAFISKAIGNPRIARVLHDQVKGLLGGVGKQLGTVGGFAGRALKDRVSSKALSNMAIGALTSKATGGSAVEGIMPSLMFGSNISPLLNAGLVGATNLAQRANAFKLGRWNAPDPSEAAALGEVDMSHYSPSRPVPEPLNYII